MLSKAGSVPVADLILGNSKLSAVQLTLQRLLVHSLQLLFRLLLDPTLRAAYSCAFSLYNQLLDHALQHQ